MIEQKLRREIRRTAVEMDGKRMKMSLGRVTEICRKTSFSEKNWHKELRKAVEDDVEKWIEITQKSAPDFFDGEVFPMDLDKIKAFFEEYINLISRLAGFELSDEDIASLGRSESVEEEIGRGKE